MVLTVGVVQAVIHAVQLRSIERQRLRPGEWHAAITLKGVRENRAASGLENQTVEPRIHVGITGFVTFFDAALAQQRVTVFEAAMQVAAQGLDTPRPPPLRSLSDSSAPRKSMASVISSTVNARTR